MRDAASGRRVAAYAGGRLKATTTLLASPTTAATKIPGSAIGVVWFDIPFTTRRAIPARLEHTVTVRVPPGLPVPCSISVTAARARADRFPDQVPNHPRPVGLDEGSGNHVVLALGGGRFAEYAYLEPGSVTVREGQRVRKGQVMGLTGNSGARPGRTCTSRS